MKLNVTLGNIAFDPGPRREIRVHGAQVLVKQDIPGAEPSYQDMGPDEETIAWDGALAGASAVDTAQQLDTLRKAGQVVEFVSWHIPLKRVRIREFNYQVRRRDRVEYDITLVLEGGVPDWTPPPDLQPQDQSGQSAQPGAGSASGTHTVAAGDTLYDLAVRYLGNGALWPAIASANGITDPGALQVGQVLRVPTSAESSTLTTQYQGEVETRNQYVEALVFNNRPGVGVITP